MTDGKNLKWNIKWVTNFMQSLMDWLKWPCNFKCVTDDGMLSIGWLKYKPNSKCVTDDGIQSFTGWLKLQPNTKWVIDGGIWQILFLQLQKPGFWQTQKTSLQMQLLMDWSKHPSKVKCFMDNGILPWIDWLKW